MDGSTIYFAYDSLNRVVSKTLPDGQVCHYTYNAVGKITAASNDAGTIYITYDELNRIKSETFNGQTVQYDYNISGRTQTTIYPDNTIVIKGFDTRNRLVSIVRNNETIVNYQYNNRDQVVAKNFSNGVNTTFQYDYANRLTGFSTGSGSIQNTAFTYDKEKNKTAVNRLNQPAKIRTV